MLSKVVTFIHGSSVYTESFPSLKDLSIRIGFLGLS